MANMARKVTSNGQTPSFQSKAITILRPSFLRRARRAAASCRAGDTTELSPFFLWFCQSCSEQLGVVAKHGLPFTTPPFQSAHVTRFLRNSVYLFHLPQLRQCQSLLPVGRWFVLRSPVWWSKTVGRNANPVRCSPPGLAFWNLQCKLSHRMPQRQTQQAVIRFQTAWLVPTRIHVTIFGLSLAISNWNSGYQTIRWPCLPRSCALNQKFRQPPPETISLAKTSVLNRLKFKGRPCLLAFSITTTAETTWEVNAFAKATMHKL